MRRVSAIVAGLTLTLSATAATAGDFVVSVMTTRNKPVADAVVTAYAPPGAKLLPRPAGPLVMDQHNLQFDPFVLVAPVGADVTFPNQDAVRHHVYSFSPAKVFELKLYGRDENRSVRFDRAGVVALGCNIHDNMVAFIKVVDTPYAAKSNAAGQATLRGLPAGPIQLRIWHPYLKAPDNEMSITVQAPASGAGREMVQIDVRAAADRRGSY